MRIDDCAVHDVFTEVSQMKYVPPLLLRGGHVATIFPAVARRVPDVAYERMRIETDDGDFLDVDWSRTKATPRGVVILCHGLEGSSARAYMRGMARAVNRENWDALAWNYRACSGVPNRRLRFYHNGATDDLSRVVREAVARGGYDRIALVGFSLGGNLVLNYLWWHQNELPATVYKAAVFSVPLDIASSAHALSLPANRIYMKRFLKDLGVKIKAKEKQFPGQISSEGYDAIKDFAGFDNRYTAPLHGFADAMDYWTRCSGNLAIPHITVPTLIVNAQNDPFLTPACFPTDAIVKNEKVHLLTPVHGGHCGFAQFGPDGNYWSETAACTFFRP